MYKIFLLPLLLLIPISTFAFDAACFREYTQITVSNIADVTTSIPTLSEDIFFVQSDNILKSSVITAEKNPPVRYTLDGSNNAIILQDLDPKTALEIDPFLLNQNDYSITADLGRVYDRGVIASQIGYYSPSWVSLSVSKDGTNFINVTEYSLSNFDFRYLRVTFLRSKIQSNITLLHTLIFFENKNMLFLVRPQRVGKVEVYKGSFCSNAELQKYRISQQGLFSPRDTTTPSIPLEFFPNPLYKNDQDQDGIENILDNCPTLSNPDQADRNNDGIGDMCSDDDNDGVYGASDNCPTLANPDQVDKNVNGTWDKCEFDTDRDGVPDGTDNAIQVANPNQKDDDYDRIGDIIDNCNLYNPDQLDLDKNGIGDACDRDREYRQNNDTDKDTILDSLDNCRYTANTDQSDVDKDGIWDACDNCKLLQNPDQKDDNKNGIGDMCDDTDSDGIEWWRDNCPTIANPNQKDSNNDGVGDMCSDTDGDTIYDSQDNCPVVYNPKQENIDKDDMWDTCDSTDSRFIESNKYAFMSAIGIFAMAFIGMIIFLLMKLNKPKKTP